MAEFHERLDQEQGVTASEEGRSESTAYAKVQERASVRSRFKVSAFQKHTYASSLVTHTASFAVY